MVCNECKELKNFLGNHFKENLRLIKRRTANERNKTIEIYR